MPHDSISADVSLIPPQPIPPGAAEFSKQVGGLLDGRPKDDETVAQALAGQEDMLDVIAAGFYSMASMLVGEGEDSMRLVERAVEMAEISVCHDVEQERKSSRRALCTAALALLDQRNPGCLAFPQGLVAVKTCIEDDDLDEAGVSREELETMLAGPNRESVKNWLESLPTETRAIFVLRAVAGFTAPETAAMLAAHGGPDATGWNADAVREIFRRGLCSLASQLIQANAAR
jgi:hypothetical protein